MTALRVSVLFSILIPTHQLRAAREDWVKTISRANRAHFHPEIYCYAGAIDFIQAWVRSVGTVIAVES